jgi:hypothetical protein
MPNQTPNLDVIETLELTLYIDYELGLNSI